MAAGIGAANTIEFRCPESIRECLRIENASHTVVTSGDVANGVRHR